MRSISLGVADGHALDDWLQAELELRNNLKEARKWAADLIVLGSYGMTKSAGANKSLRLMAGLRLSFRCYK